MHVKSILFGMERFDRQQFLSMLECPKHANAEYFAMFTKHANHASESIPLMQYLDNYSIELYHSHPLQLRHLPFIQNALVYAEWCNFL